MRYFKKFEGETVYLSPVNIEDHEIYCAWINSMEVSVRLGNGAEAYSLETEKHALETLSKNINSYNFAIILKKNDQLIGNVSLFKINKTHQEATLGIFIGEKENRGKGYGREAIELILDYGFSFLNLHNIMLNVFDFNEDAVRLYEKIGFRVFGRRSEVHYLDGKRHDQLFMEILKKDFTKKVIIRNY